MRDFLINRSARLKRFVLICRPVDWMVRFALRIRGAQLRAIGLSDAAATSMHD